MLNTLAGRIPLLSQNQELEKQMTQRYWHKNPSILYYFCVVLLGSGFCYHLNSHYNALRQILNLAGIFSKNEQHFTSQGPQKELEMETEKSNLTSLQAKPKKISRHFWNALFSQKNI